MNGSNNSTPTNGHGRAHGAQADSAECSCDDAGDRERMAALGTLSAGVAHEINNPLTYVLINVDHVLRRLRAAGASDDALAELSGPGAGGVASMVEALEHAVQGAHRIRDVVHALLTFAQGNIDRRTAVDVRGVVESATQLAWHEIRHRARLTKCLGEVPFVMANEARLGQVFLDLLVNAAQAIPEGQADRNEVCVVTRTDEQGRAVIEISDTGSGIPAEHRSRVFDPFFTSRGVQGAGLGLASALGTVRGLGGEIAVTSGDGRGTTVRVVLRGEDRLFAAPPSSRQARSLQRRRVLVVDDEPLVAKCIAGALSDDHEVEVVADSRQALEKIAASSAYDAILCDLMMPVMTGMDFYVEVMRLDPALAGRIVFMTGGAFSPRARAFVDGVVNPCLEKPIDILRLRRALASAGQRPPEPTDSC
jgi:CheY-like chemotaxis protein